MPTVGLVVDRNDDWSEYLAAAQRKVDIARFHAERLGASLGMGANNPTVEVQAHFEGVIYGFVASCDQVGEAINLAYDFGLKNANLQDALEQMPHSSLRSRLFRWQQAPIAADVRDIRRRAVHHHYEKTPNGPHLYVQVPSRARAYGGSRTLEVYAAAATDHLGQLEPLLDQLHAALRHIPPDG
jgi:hypothetical protein